MERGNGEPRAGASCGSTVTVHPDPISAFERRFRATFCLARGGWCPAAGASGWCPVPGPVVVPLQVRAVAEMIPADTGCETGAGLALQTVLVP